MCIFCLIYKDEKAGKFLFPPTTIDKIQLVTVLIHIAEYMGTTIVLPTCFRESNVK